MSGVRDLESMLRHDEGVMRTPYKDSRGKLSIGVGRNLDDVGVDDHEIGVMLDADIGRAARAVEDLILPGSPPGLVVSHTSARYCALVGMAFTLGRNGLAGFSGFLKAARAGDWSRAADEMLWRDPGVFMRVETPWYREAPKRVARAACRVRTDEW